MKRWLFLLILYLSLPVSIAFAQKVVSGVVVDGNKEPLIGVSVLIQGTSSGGTTDFDGKYSVTVSEGASLKFAYIGMEDQIIKVGSSSVIDVVMKPAQHLIDEVVVTAMGVRQEKKRMNFAVQSINADDIMIARTTNVVDALQGKIAGVSVTNQGGSPNGSSQMIIRGISSINGQQNNEPLFIIDGMQMSGGSSAMSQINTNDIENVTVLKGAAASALYGQDGANGVVMITTKTAEKGRTVINASSSFQVDNAVRVPKIQSIYGSGHNGVVGAAPTTGGWGSPLLPGTPIYNNAEEFFQTALMSKTDVSISAATDKFTAYASMNYLSQEGIVPEDKIDRVGLMLKASYNISPTLSFSFMANINNSISRDAGSGYMSRVYSWPIDSNMKDYKNADGSMNWLYISDTFADSPVNPYWTRYEDWGEKESRNNLLQAQGSWKAFKNFELTGRLGYDSGNSVSQTYTTPRFKVGDYDQPGDDLNKYKDADNSIFGSAYMSSSNSYLFNAQAMAKYTHSISQDMNLEVMVGTELKMNKSKTIRLGGTEFVLDDYYSILNLKNSITGTGQDNYPGYSQKNIYGYFGELRYDYKGLASLSVTLRNDHSSTLSVDNNSYWYPSVTGGLVFSEIFNLGNNVFSYGKIRGNWAKVGKDARPYQFGQKFAQKVVLPDGGYGIDPTKSVVAGSLMPEMAKSWEIGADLRFFDSKTRLDVAYYSTGVDNQIVSVRVSPAAGSILQTRNEGSIENRGVEITLDQDVLRSNQFSWTSNVNFGLNRGKVTSLPDQLTELAFTSGQVGADIFPTAYLNGSTTGISGKDYLRTDDGKIIVSENGYPVIDPRKALYIGNREADFRVGFSNNLRYNDWMLSFLIDFRKGGDVVNGTARSLYSSGQHHRLETYRNRQVVIDGVVEQADGTYVANTTPIILDNIFFNNYYNTVSTNFIEDGSYIRFSYVTLGYDFSKFVKKTAFKTLKATLTGRNLFLITKYSGSDPQINSLGNSGGSGSMGIDNLSVPNTRSFNITINATF